MAPAAAAACAARYRRQEAGPSGTAAPRWPPSPSAARTWLSFWMDSSRSRRAVLPCCRGMQGMGRAERAGGGGDERRRAAVVCALHRLLLAQSWLAWGGAAAQGGGRGRQGGRQAPKRVAAAKLGAAVMLPGWLAGASCIAQALEGRPSSCGLANTPQAASAPTCEPHLCCHCARCCCLQAQRLDVSRSRCARSNGPLFKPCCCQRTAEQASRTVARPGLLQRSAPHSTHLHLPTSLWKQGQQHQLTGRALRLLPAPLSSPAAQPRRRQSG